MPHTLPDARDLLKPKAHAVHGAGVLSILRQCHSNDSRQLKIRHGTNISQIQLKAMPIHNRYLLTRGVHERQRNIAGIANEIDVTKPLLSIKCEKHIMEFTVAHRFTDPSPLVTSNCIDVIDFI